MINVSSPISHLGYGVHGSNMIKAFADKDIEVSLTPIGDVQEDSYFCPFITKAREVPFNSNRPTLNIFHSEHAGAIIGSPKINFCVFETTLINNIAKKNLNESVDVVFTTTEEHRNILIDNGIQRPIRVIHEGVDTTLYNTTKIDKLINTGKFTFITAGKAEKRKNTNKVILSFIDTMQFNECALICHTYNPFTKSFLESGMNVVNMGYRSVDENHTYYKYSNGISDIYFTKPIDSVIKMKSLYNSANVGIMASSAEGWGLPVGEMLACGIPCITTNCIGHKEFIPRDLLKDLVIYPTEKEVAYDGIWFNGKNGEWDKITGEDIRDRIEIVWDNQEKFLLANSDLFNYINNNYTWSHSVETVLNNLYY